MIKNLKRFAKEKMILQQSMDIEWDDEEIERKFNFVSAELLEFLPEVPYSEHQNIFKNILLNTRFNKLEQKYPCVLDKVSLHNYTIETENFIRNNPCIFCTWHFGAYKLINHFLAGKGISYSLVISKGILETEGSNFIEQFNIMYGKGQNNNLTIIDAESPQAGLKILRNIKKGKSILFYIDGNVGTGSTRDSINNCYIDFLNSKIFARKGVAFLSHIANVPILPIISYRKGTDEIIFDFGQLMFPDKEKDRNEFAIDCTQKLYNQIASRIKIYPDQWEAWLYLYKVIISNNSHLEQVDVEPGLHKSKLKFNSLIFGIYKFEDSYYLFHKKQFKSFTINHDLYSFLKNSITNEVLADRLDESLFDQFCKNQVLIRAN